MGYASAPTSSAAVISNAASRRARSDSFPFIPKMIQGQAMTPLRVGQLVECRFLTRNFADTIVLALN